MLSSSIESWLRTTVLLTLSLPLNAVALPAQDPQPSGGAQDALDSSSASRALNGPVTQGMFADPAVMKVDNTYYAYATNVGNKRVPIATSRNFKDWEITDQDALPGPLPAWVDQGEGQSLWGPDVYQPSPGNFVLYFTATIKHANQKRCIGVATSNSPTGPFKPQGDKPVVCRDNAFLIGGAGWFDPSLNGGKKYMVYRQTTYAPRVTSILAQQMSDDGVKTVGQPFELIKAEAADEDITESPSLVYADGTYVLLYSTHHWYTDLYTVSVATAPKLEGPWKKHDRPLIKTGTLENGKPTAPGSADVLFRADQEKLPDGGERVSMVLHATQEGQGGEGGGKIRRMWTATAVVKGEQVTLG